MEDTNYQFNSVSENHLSRLNNEEKKFVSNNMEDARAAVKALDADHAANKDQRITDEAKRLADENVKSFNMPRPEGTPAPRLKTKQEIESRAVSNVLNAHDHARQKIMLDSRKRESDFIKKALDIPDRGPPNEPDNGRDR